MRGMTQAPAAAAKDEYNHDFVLLADIPALAESQHAAQRVRVGERDDGATAESGGRAKRTVGCAVGAAAAEGAGGAVRFLRSLGAPR
jgi:hypothetical protein